MPVFSGFSTVKSVQKARAELSKAEAELDRRVIEIQQEVLTAFSTFVESEESVQATEAQVKDAIESVRLASDRYKAGAGTINDLLDAQSASSRAEATLITARLNYQIAQTAFRRARVRLDMASTYQ